MNYSFKTISLFEKQLKKLAKKYPSIKQDYSEFLQLIKSDPTIGIPLGRNCYKIRFAISSKGKGKSGGARIITHVVVSQSDVYLLNIYDKSDKETLTEKEIQQLLDLIAD